MNPPPAGFAPHPREDLHRFVNQLNVRYNIGILIPDPCLTPVQRRENETVAGRIYRRLETHFYKGGLDALDVLLRDFDCEAKALWSKWVKKPKADAGTLPRTAIPPLAANHTERTWLQKLFSDVLDRAQPRSMPSQRVFGRSRSGPSAFGAGEQSEVQPKRRADVAPEGDTSVKRAKADPIRDLTATASCRQTQRASATTRCSAAMPRPIVKSFSSANTSMASAQSIFSHVAANPTPGTQQTIEASSQEQKRPPEAPYSQGSYVEAPSSTMENALNESFCNYEASFGKSNTMDPKRRVQIPAPASLASESSYKLSSATQDVLRPTSEDDRRGQRSIFAQKPESDPDPLYKAWPVSPPWLRMAPFPVVWEVTRIAQACGVDLSSIHLAYTREWTDQTTLRATLRKHEAFRGKVFPEASNPQAWGKSLEQAVVTASDQQVTYTACLDFDGRAGAGATSSGKSMSFNLTLRPIKLEKPHRLGRKFGPDRFFELLVPSPDSSNVSKSLRNADTFFGVLVQWLTERQTFCCRFWKAFYTKSGGSRKPVKDLHFGPDPKPVFQDRIYFFAEQAVDATCPGAASEPIPIHKMLDWTLEFKHRKNRDQPLLKLFQRIALALSRTSPTVVFEPNQIRHRPNDLMSPVGKEMNDGVARMSPAAARKIRASLNLNATPSALQARLGSAKGMWIIDTTDTSDEIWIETYPSQRKWELDWDNVDEHHRTLEVRSVAAMPKSASFNLQFLPVLEDRAVDKVLMRNTIGKLLKDNLQEDLDSEKRALDSPLQFRQWIHANSKQQHNRIIHGHVAYRGGFPEEDEEIMISMLDAGFEPKTNKFLKDIAYNMQKRKCEFLGKKLNIRVKRSSYLYMVVDFLGVLEEDEVHIGFSTAFEADEDWSNDLDKDFSRRATQEGCTFSPRLSHRTMVQGLDVLVARSPAHFISDVQKVKAVFKPELSDLTDVIVFSSKGDIPLADKLSGGDYDGDLAWVCWDSRIVDNFTSAPVQKQPDLSEYMPKNKETLREVLKENDSRLKPALKELLRKSFAFNLGKSMLGLCTNYKERLCYSRNSVSDDAARLLSTVLSNLVDQAKQGISFTDHDFGRLKQDFKLPRHVDEPMYKKSHGNDKKHHGHIIDFLKFEIAQPTIGAELREFHAVLESKESGAHQFDKDLLLYYDEYTQQAMQSKSVRRIMQGLQANIGRIYEEWQRSVAEKTIGYSEVIARCYEEWQHVQVDETALGRSTLNSKTIRILGLGGEMSHWAMLKASMAFYLYHRRSAAFVYHMAGRQLCYIKAQATATRKTGGAVSAPNVVMPALYAALRPDAKFVKQRVAREEGVASHFSFDGDEAGGGGGDDDDVEPYGMDEDDA